MKYGLNMNKFRSTLFSLSLTLFLSIYATAGQAESMLTDEVLILVNDSVILQSDVDTAVTNLKINAQDKELPNENILHKQVINQLIMEKLQLQQAKKLGIKVDDAKVDQAIQNVAQQHNVSVAQLRKKIISRGLDFALYREQIRQDLVLNETKRAYIRRRISFLPQEVEQLAKQLGSQTNRNVEYKLSHIQIPVAEDATQQEKEAALKKAQVIIKKYKDGENFSTLAYTYSSGPKALQGGAWDWMKPQEMPAIFAEEINVQDKGTIIGPFKSGLGFHILIVDDVKGLKTAKVEEVNARHILLKTSPIFSDKAAQKRLNTISKSIQDGSTTFAQKAEEYSDDPGSATQGGELGWQTPDIYVPEFRDMIKKLKPGVISKPFKTVHGWHIVEVLDLRTINNTEAALKDQAYRMLANRKFNEELQSWQQELKAGAYIHYIEKDETVED